MPILKETPVVLKKSNGETIMVRNPDHVSYPDPSQPYWVIVKDKDEIRTLKDMRGTGIA